MQSKLRYIGTLLQNCKVQWNQTGCDRIRIRTESKYRCCCYSLHKVDITIWSFCIFEQLIQKRLTWDQRRINCLLRQWFFNHSDTFLSHIEIFTQGHELGVLKCESSVFSMMSVCPFICPLMDTFTETGYQKMQFTDVTLFVILCEIG